MPFHVPNLVLAMGLLCFLACHRTASQEEEWEPIFNGEDLAGWTPKIVGHPAGENWRNTFVVEDSVLKVSYAEYDSFRLEFGHLFYRDTLRYYKLRLEYRFTGPRFPGTPDWAVRNSGLMLHGQSAESMGLEQGFPVSLEAQFLGGLEEGAPRPTANLCTPGMHVEMEGRLVTAHCVESTSPTFYHDDWIRFEVVVGRDGVIHHLVEGDTAISYTGPVIGGEYLPRDFPEAEGSPVRQGTISLQSEGHPVEFRRIELCRLP